MTISFDSNYFKGVVFDIGDTFIETKPLMLDGAQYASMKMKENGFIQSKDKLINKFFEIDKITTFPHINHFFSSTKIIENAIVSSGILLTKNTFSLTTIANIFLAIYRDRIRESIKPINKIKNLLSRLKGNGYKLGVISNGSLEGQIEVLTKLEIYTFFDDILISEEVGYEKPTTEIFSNSSTRLGIETKRLIFVGDEWNADIIGSYRAGFFPILTTEFNDDSPRDTNKEVKYEKINNLSELLEVLQIPMQESS